VSLKQNQKNPSRIMLVVLQGAEFFQVGTKASVSGQGVGFVSVSF
jgi:hypothetical protein